MGTHDFSDYDALGLADLIRTGQVTPDELLDATLEAIPVRDSRVGSVWTVLEERARRVIRAGLPDGPFRGVPFVLKDLGIKLEGEVTTNGSKFFEGDVARFTSELAKRYEAAGLVVFGKVATSEFGLGPSADTDVRPRTNNPWDVTRVAGGSSTGSAAAVAARILPAAHASDGGGSIRIPAACCGVFGFKPSRGVNTYAPVAESWSGMSVQHAITRSVRDSAALLDCTAGAVPGDPYHCPLPDTSFLSATQRDPRPMRIAMHVASVDGVRAEPEIVDAVETMATLLTELGHDVIHEEPTFDMADASRLYSIITSASVRMMIEDRAAALGRDPREDELLNVTRHIAANGSSHRAVDLARAREACFAAARQIAHYTERFDAVLCPTIAHLPPTHGTYDMRSTDLTSYMSAIFRFAPFTAPASLAGQPAMNVPFGFSANGLPIGVHFSAGFGRDATLFSLAAQIERAASWADARPPL